MPTRLSPENTGRCRIWFSSISVFASVLDVSGQVKISFLVMISLTVFDAKFLDPPDKAYTRSLSVRIPTTEDLERWSSDLDLQIISAPILFLFIRAAASNKSESSEL